MVQKRSSAADKGVAAAAAPGKAKRPLYDAPKSPLPKRGRPRAYDPEDALKRARERVLGEAVCRHDAYYIVEATGMNRPSLYAAFGDKEAIYLAALKMQGELLVGAVAGAVKLDLKLKPFLDLFFDRCIESYLAGANGLRGCFLCGHRADGIADAGLRSRRVVRDAFERVDGLLEGRFRRRRRRESWPRAQTRPRWPNSPPPSCTSFRCTPAPDRSARLWSSASRWRVN